MKQICSLLVAVIVATVFQLAPIQSVAQTTVPGGYLSGHWTLAGSPYNIMGSVMIPNDSTLTIDPGVNVNFQTASHLKMLVKGRLIAVGTAAQNISITATDHTNGFGGIRFVNLDPSNDTSRFVYCNIQYGFDGIAPYNNGGAIAIKHWNKVVIDHCNIQYCKSTNGFYGGAIYCSNSNIAITNSTVANNKASFGGGIYADSATTFLIAHNTISNNSASSGGGICLYRNVTNAIITDNILNANTITGNDGAAVDISYYCSVLNFSNNIITNNTNSFTYTGSGAINNGGTITLMNNNTITGNSASTYYGGGIANSGTIGIISNNTIKNNTVGSGGGICSISGTINTISGNVISGNHANSGGGIYCGGGTINTVSYNTISNNSGGSYGGGIDIDGSGTITTIANNLIINNSTTSLQGGGIYCNNTISTISHNVITGNSAHTDGGGIWCGSSGTITAIDNCLITNNTANLSSGNGGGLYLDGKAGANHPTITNVTLANNSAFNGGAVYCLNTCNPVFNNSILWGNTDNALDQVFLYDQYSSPTFTFCDVQGGQAAINPNGNFYTGTYTNSISGDPKFVSPSAGSGNSYNANYNWTLQGTSPCRDAGNPSGSYPATDLGGNTRVYGSKIDMGAYEYQMTLSTTSTPVNCHGSQTGTATVAVVNGHPNYIYSWSTNPPQTEPTATGLSVGTYSITVTDAQSANAVATVVVTEPKVLLATIHSTNASCANNNGAAMAAVTGGTPPYTYAWSNALITDTLMRLKAGVYTVSVTDTMGCVTTAFAAITINSSIAPAPLPICYVTVDTTSSYNVIYWNTTGLNNIDSIFVYRDTANNNFALIGGVKSKGTYFFNDTVRQRYHANGDPNVSSWRYAIAIKDSCGKMSALSPYHQTMFLQQNGGNFSWAQYAIQGQTMPIPELTNYLVQRDSAGAKPFQTIQTLSASSTQYTDPNYAKFISTGIWRIETQWNMNCNALPSGKMNGANAQNTSRSNVRNNYIFTGMSNVHEVAQTVLVYPNPATGLVNIQLNGENKQGTYQVILYNMLGGIVYQSIEEKASTTIDVSPFEKGIYTLCLRTQTNNKVQRLVIMK